MTSLQVTRWRDDCTQATRVGNGRARFRFTLIPHAVPCCPASAACVYILPKGQYVPTDELGVATINRISNRCRAYWRVRDMIRSCARKSPLAVRNVGFEGVSTEHVVNGCYYWTDDVNSPWSVYIVCPVVVSSALLGLLPSCLGRNENRGANTPRLT